MVVAMSKLEFTGHCPVCRMTNISSSLTFNYQGVEHYFCSSQCLERFVAHPHLFVGDPKHGLSPKQRGLSALKKRRIGFAKPIDEELKAELKQSVLLLMGIKELIFDQECLYVTYDLLQVSLEQIESVIEQSSERLQSGLVNQVSRTFIHFSEECELDNLAHLTRDSSCH